MGTFKKCVNKSLVKIGDFLWKRNRLLREENEILRSELNRLQIERDYLFSDLSHAQHKVEELYDWAQRLLKGESNQKSVGEIK